ncbi:MAG: hypothetical protein FJ104_04695, partial [Deltaproteobacteria bacterium]|nr:hypothetical protein [Deltaproteobacteria bacterium]
MRSVSIAIFALAAASGVALGCTDGRTLDGTDKARPDSGEGPVDASRADASPRPDSGEGPVDASRADASPADASPRADGGTGAADGSLADAGGPPPPVCPTEGADASRISVVTTDVPAISWLTNDGDDLYFTGRQCVMKCGYGPFVDGLWRVPIGGGPAVRLAEQASMVFPPVDGAIYFLPPLPFTGGINAIPNSGQFEPVRSVGALAETTFPMYPIVVGGGLIRGLRVEPLNPLFDLGSAPPGELGRVVLMSRPNTLPTDPAAPLAPHEERVLANDYDLSKLSCGSILLARDGARLYAALANQLFEITDTGLVVLATVDQCVQDILPYEGHVYLSLTFPTRRQVGRVPVTGGALELLADSRDMVPRMVGAGGGMVYWLGADAGCGRLHAIRAATGEAMTVPIADRPLDYVTVD